MNVAYAKWFEAGGKSFLVELRVVPATRNRPHIHHQGHTVSFEEPYEFVHGSGRMPNRENSQFRRQDDTPKLCPFSFIPIIREQIFNPVAEVEVTSKEARIINSPTKLSEADASHLLVQGDNSWDAG